MQNDRVVMDAYAFVVGTPEQTSESACVAALMRRYQGVTKQMKEDELLGQMSLKESVDLFTGNKK